MFDLKQTGWWREGEIDLTRLRMSSGCDCVVGQLWPGEMAEDDLGPFSAAVNRGWLDLTFEAAKRFGLYSESSGRDTDDELDEYSELTAEWRRVITERRAAE